MKPIALITLIISHNELTGTPPESNHIKDTPDLMFDLINGDAAGWEYGVDVIDMTVTPLTLGIDKGGDDE